MALNRPVKGPGGPAPLTPETGALIRRPSTALVPQRTVATTRSRSDGGPPARPGAQQAGAGHRPQTATLPPRRAALPTTLAAPGSAHSAPSDGMPPGFGSQRGDGLDPMKELARQVESLTKTAQEALARHIEATNRSTDGVKDAVSPPAA